MPIAVFNIRDFCYNILDTEFKLWISLSFPSSPLLCICKLRMLAMNSSNYCSTNVLMLSKLFVANNHRNGYLRQTSTWFYFLLFKSSERLAKLCNKCCFAKCLKKETNIALRVSSLIHLMKILDKNLNYFIY
jgi:hypothetical protein